MKNYNDERPLIVSPNEDISILEVAKVIAERFKLNICFDDSIPDGQLVRRSDSSLFESLDTGVNLNNTNLIDALHETIEWFTFNVDKSGGCVRINP